MIPTSVLENHESRDAISHGYRSDLPYPSVSTGYASVGTELMPPPQISNQGREPATGSLPSEADTAVSLGSIAGNVEYPDPACCFPDIVKVFTQNDSLTQHRISRAGFNPFASSICHSGFTSKLVLLFKSLKPRNVSKCTHL